MNNITYLNNSIRIREPTVRSYSIRPHGESSHLPLHPPFLINQLREGGAGETVGFPASRLPVTDLNEDNIKIFNIYINNAINKKNVRFSNKINYHIIPSRNDIETVKYNLFWSINELQYFKDRENFYRNKYNLCRVSFK